MSSSNIPETLKAKVRLSAKDRCGYCLSKQKYVLGVLEIDQIIPKASGGSDEESNLWLACRLCNGYKGTQTEAEDPQTNQVVSLFNPRKQKWAEPFQWSKEGTLIIGLTPYGRATVKALQLNNFIAVMVRQKWGSAGWHPPKDI